MDRKAKVNLSASLGSLPVNHSDRPQFKLTVNGTNSLEPNAKPYREGENSSDDSRYSKDDVQNTLVSIDSANIKELGSSDSERASLLSYNDSVFTPKEETCEPLSYNGLASALSAEDFRAVSPRQDGNANTVDSVRISADKEGSRSSDQISRSTEHVQPKDSQSYGRFAVNTSVYRKQRPSLSAVASVDAEPPRRLSQLFIPPSEEDLRKEKENAQNNVSRLLPKPDGFKQSLIQSPTERSGVKLRSSKKGFSGKITKESADGESETLLNFVEDGEEQRMSTSEHSSIESDDEGVTDVEDEALSYNDTICSQRSAWFKHYYMPTRVDENSKPKSAPRRSSLAGLIHEKTQKIAAQLPVPAKDSTKRRKEDVSLMILVIVLFVVLVIAISLIHYFYHLHLLELSLFQKVKFHEDNRLLDVYDSSGKLTVLMGVGRHLPRFGLPDDCTYYMNFLKEYSKGIEPDVLNNLTDPTDVLKRRKIDEFDFDKDTVCLDWANQARLQIHRAIFHKEANCYQIFWSGKRHETTLRDCLFINDPNLGVWWGLGEHTQGGFPLGKVQIDDELYLSGSLGRHPWGRVVRRVMVSSMGGLVMLPDHLPVLISVNSSELCLTVNKTEYFTSETSPFLNYTLCSTSNISTTLKYLHNINQGEVGGALLKSFLKKKASIYKSIAQRIENPLWIPFVSSANESLTEESVLNYANSIVSEGVKRWGGIMLPLEWENIPGDLNFDSKRFPNPKNMVDGLHKKGFKLILTISPLVSTDSISFKNGTADGLWMLQKESSLPALVQFGDVHTAALADFTNSKSKVWFTSKIQNLMTKYQIDGVHLSYPDSHSIPSFHDFRIHLTNPDVSMKEFVRTVTEAFPTISTDNALTPPPFPTFVVLGNEDSGWSSLASLVPRILTLSMIGFPLIDAGVIGGIPGRIGNLPEDELFIRWNQAAAFLPSYQQKFLPSLYSESTQSIIASAQNLRETLALPRLKANIDAALRNSTPLLFPLGYLYPDDNVAASVQDEWILGKDLLIAPVLEKNTYSRMIYLPHGLWESHDNRYQRGPGWYEHKVSLSEVAYFFLRYKFT